MFLSSPVLGSLSDKYGRKKILLLSLWGNALGFAISAIGVALNMLWLIILGRIIAGCTAGSLTIAQAAIIDTSAPEQKAARLGWVGMANGIGFACGPAIGGLMLNKNIWQNIHYEFPFWFCVVLAALGAILVQICFYDTFQGNNKQKIDVMIGVNNIVKAFKKNTRFYCLMMLFFMLGWNIFFNEIPLFLDERFFAHAAKIGYFLAYITIIFSFSMLVLLPKVVKIWKLESLIAVSLILQVIFQFIFAISHSWLFLWLSITPLVIVVPFAYIGIITEASNLTDVNHQGEIMGVITSISAFTWGLGPVITGLLSKSYLTDPYYVSISVIFIAFLLALRTQRRRTIN